MVVLCISLIFLCVPKDFLRFSMVSYVFLWFSTTAKTALPLGPLAFRGRLQGYTILLRLQGLTYRIQRLRFIFLCFSIVFTHVCIIDLCVSMDPKP
jgi:hypothetical protein